MISRINSSVAGSVYANTQTEQKESAKLDRQAHISKQGDMSKVEQIKESIEAGTYQINLQALSEKIAGELL